MTELTVLFNEFVRFCVEHGRDLKAHTTFGNMSRELRSRILAMEVVSKRQFATMAKLREVVLLGQQIREEAITQEPFSNDETMALLTQWDAAVGPVLERILEQNQNDAWRYTMGEGREGKR